LPPYALYHSGTQMPTSDSATMRRTTCASLGDIAIACCHSMLCFEVGDAFDVQVLVHPVTAAPTSFAIVRHCVRHPMALLKSPCYLYALPTSPYAMPSPARSPTSFSIARGRLWYLTALLSPPATYTRCQGSRTSCTPPSRSPTSFAIASRCPWYLTALLSHPANHTRCRGSRCPPPPGGPPPSEALGFRVQGLGNI
jgi:hypothetical protein